MSYAKGKYAIAISDRSGLQFPYNEMVQEWNGMWVHTSEYEPKAPQLMPHEHVPDPQALEHPRPARVAPVTTQMLSSNLLDLQLEVKVFLFTSQELLIQLLTQLCFGMPLIVALKVALRNFKEWE